MSARKTKEFEVQWGVKWTNFTATVEAATAKEAYRKALHMKVEELVVTASHEEIKSLEDLADIAKEHRVQIHDEYGASFHEDDETIDEDDEVTF